MSPGALDGYRAKRDFQRTPEPGGGPARGDGRGARFVIHEHSARRLHWDLRLEHDGALASWAIPKGLPEAPGENHFAAATEDHPLEYLDFEGEIPAGQYGAGTIAIWDRGTYDCLKWEPRKVEVRLHGERVHARYALFATGEGPEPKDWMIHRMDPPADSAREPMPRALAPMLARTGSLPREQEGWAYEIKWDGIRAIAYSRPGELRLQTRNLNDVTERYPELGRLGRALGSHSAVLDGEIVALDSDGRPSFTALQQRMQLGSRAQAARRARTTPVTYVIFDLLWLDGHPLMALPYSERRARLAELALAGESWRTPAHVVGHGAELLAATADQGLEGIVAKRLDSPYQPGLRSRDWQKIKRVGRQEFVVGGWLAGKGRRSRSVGALLLGVYEADGVLRYVGRVGSGFSDAELERLAVLLAPLAREESPFAAGPRPPRGALFCEPRLIAEVEFAEWTAAGSLRQPSYKGLREDKPASAVRREDEREQASAAAIPPLQIEARGAAGARLLIEGRELKLSNLEKVLYPESGFTKADLIDYYAALAPSLLGHLQGRALTVRRWPDGVDGKSFFQKRAPAHRPDWVRTVAPAGGRERIDYVLAQDTPTLLWLANLAAIELHTPLARAEAPARPTALVFDLDPGAPAGLLECCRVALALHGTFERLGLSSFPKTSGAKGLQVYVPLNHDGASFEQTKSLARTLAELLERSEPELVVSSMSRARRAGRVLIDWSQNDPHKTTVCVYSLRATPRPRVSAPLEWAEVEAALDSGATGDIELEAGQVRERVAARGDLFAPVLSLVQELPAAALTGRRGATS